MLRGQIKYEKLSNDIKDQINIFHEEMKIKDPDFTIEQAMEVWFEDMFDEWMAANYAAKLNIDRRKQERRQHFRVDIKKAVKNGDSRKKKDRRQNPRRKYFRLDIEVPVQVVETLIESSADDTDAFNFVGTLINISKGGFYFKFPQAIEVSSIIKVMLDLSDIDKDLKNLEALAMVVRCERLNDDEYGVGVMFSSIYNDNKEILDIFIFRNLAYYIYA